jgi:glucose-1-phosphate thymidylyltransferase
VTGLYFYDATAPQRAHAIKPSSRGELEITTLNQSYLDDNALSVELMGRGYAWFDTGTFDSLLEASEFVRTLQHRQGLSICCPEEIALMRGMISPNDVVTLAADKLNNPYYAALHNLAKSRCG